MALKSKPPAAGASPGATKKTISVTGKMHESGVLTAKKSLKRHRAVAAETIEVRLERKATAADTRTFPPESLGQMTREKRHKLLYGD